MTDRIKEFKAEFSALLKKYNVEITAADEWSGYAECGKDIQITIEFNDSQSEIKCGSYITDKTLTA